MKKSLIAGTIGVGLVASLWQILSALYASTPMNEQFPLIGLAVSGFLGWTTFYAMGGKKTLFLSGILTNISGVFWGIIFVLIMFLFPQNGIPFYVGLAIAGFVSAGMMVFQAHVKLLNFVPAAFIGCTTFFAVGGTLTLPVVTTAILGLVLGNCLGILSTELTMMFEHKRTK